MASIVEELILKMSKIDTDVLINKSVIDHREDIVLANTRNQLFSRGVNIAGMKIVPPYKPFTIRLKKANGLPTDRVTLYETGTFHKNFQVKTFEGGFEVGHYGSDVRKGTDIPKKLRDVYARETSFEGLTEDNFKKIIGGLVLKDVADKIALEIRK